MSFTPVRTLIEDVTNAVRASVTTTTNHGYQTGYVVRVIVPLAYGMSMYEQTSIVVTGDQSFTTNIDTSAQLPYVSPLFVPGGQGFTAAQVVPLTGVTDNIL